MLGVSRPGIAFASRRARQRNRPQGACRRLDILLAARIVAFTEEIEMLP
jgi:hypothetical protein